MVDPGRHEPLTTRLERYANDRRFAQIMKAFTARGMHAVMYAPDERGLMHRLDASTADAVCGAPIPREAKIEFHVHATCVRCVSAT